ncbi:MAG: hypothetical protein Q9183_004835, partial [Haloplaca sp. 2 TL-2023]
DYALYVKIAKEKILVVEEELGEYVRDFGGFEAGKDVSSGSEAQCSAQGSGLASATIITNLSQGNPPSSTSQE